MSATTPLWVTILLAVLSPILTLIGVLWTQRAADNRARVEAQLRIDHEYKKAAIERTLALYEELTLRGRELVKAGFQGTHIDQDKYLSKMLAYITVRVRVNAVAPDAISESAKVLWQRVDAYREKYQLEESPENRDAKEGASLFAALEDLDRAIGEEILKATTRE